MTPKSLKQARISAQAITEAKGKTVWKEVLKTSGMVQDDYMLNNCDPSFQLQLLDHVDALEKKLEKAREALKIISHPYTMREDSEGLEDLGTVEWVVYFAHKTLKDLES